MYIAHLCWHLELRNEVAKPWKYAFWIDPRLDTDTAEQVAAQCRKAGRTKVGIKFPYANSAPQGFFDRNLEFVYGATRLGLTCSSFVLAVCNSVGIDLVDYDDWPIRTGDIVFQERIIRAMGMSPDHAKAIRDEKTKTPRYKPLEVAGAATAGSYPVRFRKAGRHGRKLRKLIIDARREARH